MLRLQWGQKLGVGSSRVHSSGGCSGLWRQAALWDCCQSFSHLGKSRLKATSKMVSLYVGCSIILPRKPLHLYVERAAVLHLATWPGASNAGPAPPRPLCAWHFAARPQEGSAHIFSYLLPLLFLAWNSAAELATWQSGYVVSKKVRSLYHLLIEELNGTTWLYQMEDNSGDKSNIILGC